MYMWELCEHLVTWAISAVCRSLLIGNEKLLSRPFRRLKWIGTFPRMHRGGVRPTTNLDWKDTSFHICTGYEIGVREIIVLAYTACSSKREPSHFSMIGVPFSTLLSMTSLMPSQ